MNKTIKGYICGFLSAAILAGGISYAANTIRIVIDNKELIPTDANGNRVDPILIDGTTYLPVRAVANAFGQAVYWDGATSTVYLGDMDGALEYPTTTINDIDNIGEKFYVVKNAELTDNYGNSYSYAYKCGGGTYSDATFQALLNMKYSKFKGTIYVPKGCDSSYSAKILIKTDGKVIYTSPEITKTSRPIDLDIDINGCNDFQIEVTDGGKLGYIADAGFYQ